eukprot:CAMPEP_0175146728 /NCGR_PEP_ID=MMETSP0087-20121206/15548_1 /TAXON_ID=136419 /ORGANISM="Unknown Unknown, Strain D1" /LENGTH=73 /DNA_ID=CAMNT_0016431739 /DNA_START=77 /DNA_END=294 /DNA_ORIENTATION=-
MDLEQILDAEESYVRSEIISLSNSLDRAKLHLDYLQKSRKSLLRAREIGEQEEHEWREKMVALTGNPAFKSGG